MPSIVQLLCTETTMVLIDLRHNLSFVILFGQLPLGIHVRRFFVESSVNVEVLFFPQNVWPQLPTKLGSFLGWVGI